MFLFVAVARMRGASRLTSTNARDKQSTDLPFFKGDVLVILGRDDEEWYTARLKLREGMIPRNYLSDIEWY